MRKAAWWLTAMSLGVWMFGSGCGGDDAPADGSGGCQKTAEEDTTCDGVDDDCDGELDEDYAPQSCGVGPCAAQSSCAEGVEQACTPGDPASANDATCDGVDDDCDGTADEDYVPTECGEGACTAESSCVEGAEQACAPGQGAADDATCDGVDDDCDGTADEDYVPTECGEGACAATSACEDGVEQECVPLPGGAEDDTTCDGVDDDCDGTADEDYVPTECGEGACAATSACEDGVEQACVPLPGGAEDDTTCDGIDDDCDGTADEDYVPTTCGEGVCAATSACEGGVEQACVPLPGGAPDDATCDGLDDDCDGTVDEDYVPTDCGDGVCAAQSACVDGQVQACEPGEPLAADDTTCDGVDDDCSGEADEDYAPADCGIGACAAQSACANGEEQACEAGAPLAADDTTCNGVDDDCSGEADEDYVPADCGIGACAAQSACTNGEEQACEAGAPLAADDTTCDGVDDDCSGEADEDYVPVDCGQGVCAAQSSCADGQEQACEAGAPLAADDTTCDGVDDDCSGEADEDFSATCGVGACMAQATCTDGQQACVEEAPLADVDSTCDDVDDDCDGEVDDECLQSFLVYQAAYDGDTLTLTVVFEQTAGASFEADRYQPRLIELWPRWRGADLEYVSAVRGAAAEAASKNLVMANVRDVPGIAGMREGRFVLLSQENTDRVGPGPLLVITYNVLGAAGTSMTWNADRTAFAPEESDEILLEVDGDLVFP